MILIFSKKCQAAVFQNNLTYRVINDLIWAMAERKVNVFRPTNNGNQPIGQSEAIQQLSKAKYFSLGKRRDGRSVLVTSNDELRPNPARILTTQDGAIEFVNTGSMADFYKPQNQQIREIMRQALLPSILGSRYEQEIVERSRNVDSVPTSWQNIHEFFAANQPDENAFDNSEIGKRYQTVSEQLSPDLKRRLKNLYLGVVTLSNIRDGLQVPDADIIQSWAVQLIKPYEFKEVAMAAFPEWADRLNNNPIPHIAQANEWIGGKVAQVLQGRDSIKYADFGMGTGRSIKATVDVLRDVGVSSIDVVGVDIASNLVDVARTFLAENEIPAHVEVNDAMSWLQGQEDNSLDAITMVYAIHHLPYEQQVQLETLIFRKLKSGGVYAVADPTGRSDFNLSNLDIKEPEATAACFRERMTDVVVGLMHTGFTIDYSGSPQEVTGTLGTVSTELGNTLDQGRLGYALVAVKP